MLAKAARWAGLVWLLAGRALAQASGADQDALGFGDTTLAPEVEPARTSSATVPTPSPWRLTGMVAVRAAMRLEQSGSLRLASLRQTFAPRLEYQRSLWDAASLALVLSGRGEADFAYLLRPDDYDAPTVEIYGSQLIVGESYLRLSAVGGELAFGAQIVNLGQGELLSVLDVVNPRDLREPLSQELDQLRLPVLMTRVGVTLASLRADLLVVHEAYFGLWPPPLGEFSPFRRLLTANPVLSAVFSELELRNQHLPERGVSRLEDSQLHGRLAFSGRGVDLSLQASSLLDSLGIPGSPRLTSLAEHRVELPIFHPRYTLLGHAGAFSAGPVVLRWELATELNRPLVLIPTSSRLPLWSSARFDTLRGMMGVTYVLNGSSNLSLELMQTVVLQSPDRQPDSQVSLLFPVEATQLALRASQQLLRERLTLTLVVLCIGLAELNALAGRAEASYALLDSLRLSVGLVSYLPSENFGPFYGFERNDRLFTNLRWDFAAQ